MQNADFLMTRLIYCSTSLENMSLELSTRSNLKQFVNIYRQLSALILGIKNIKIYHTIYVIENKHADQPRHAYANNHVSHVLAHILLRIVIKIPNVPYAKKGSGHFNIRAVRLATSLFAAQIEKKTSKVSL